MGWNNDALDSMYARLSLENELIARKLDFCDCLFRRTLRA